MGEAVRPHKGGQIRVKGGERLRPGPLVLHDAEEVHHLVAKGGQVACGGGGNLAGNAPKPLLNELFQAPPGAVAGEHGQIVNVEIAAFVGLSHLRVVNLAEPVVGGDSPGVGQNQPAHGVGDGGILLHPPVVDVQVVVDQILIVQHGGA
ncbi:hypothetical protein SDC9_156000 [bioreactor metagenome]|uniref:Uncharacterized protein n=1 Tax=bioreactor metagenome TaxID=1076179 RepID=A0A645F324_9ZZZZ